MGWFLVRFCSHLQFYHTCEERFCVSLIVLFQTFVNIICHMITGLKISLFGLVCFSFFMIIVVGAAEQNHLFPPLFWSVSSVPRSVWWNASSPFKVYLYIVLFSHLWGGKKIHFHEHTWLSFYWLRWPFFSKRKWPLDGSKILRWEWAAVWFFF